MVTEPVVGVGLAMATAYGIREFYNQWKQKELKKEIDDAATGYTKNLYVVDDEEKQASSRWLQALADAPRDAFFLPAIASGIGTYGLLNHTFPAVKEKKAPGTPKKIVVRGFGKVKVDGPGDGPLADLDNQALKSKEAPSDSVTVSDDTAKQEPDTWRKAASFTFGVRDRFQAAELLCLTLVNHPALKEASSPLLEILGGYHRGRETLDTVVKTAGILGGISASKGAAEYFSALPEFEKRATVYSALNNPLYAQSLVALALAEFHEVSPAHSKVAYSVAQDPELATLVTKFASVFHTLETATWLMRNPQEKSAAHSKFLDSSSDNLGTLDLAASVDSDGQDKNPDNDAMNVYRGNQDPIDKLMSPKK
jgi:hypothetical protein